MTVMSAGAIAGPLVGGALIPVLGYSALYLIDTITLFATLYAVYKLPSLPAPGRATTTPGLRSVLEGLRYLGMHHIVMVSFIVDLIAMIFGMPRAVFPEVSHTVFGGNPEGGIEFALLYAGMPIGAVLGGVLGGWISRVRRYGLAVLVAISAWGAAMVAAGIAFEFAPQARVIMLVAAVTALAVGGASDMSSAAFRQSILLGETNDHVRGRLQGVFIVVVAGGPRIADFLHGGASEFIGIRTLKSAPASDVAILVICFALTVIFDMVLAVAVGVGLAAALFIRRMAELTQARRLDPTANGISDDLPHQVALYDITGPLFFGAAEKAIASLRVVDTGIKVVIIDMRNVPSLDATAIVTLEALIEELHARQVGLVFSGLPPRLVLKLKRAGIRRKANQLAIVRTPEHARRVAERWLALLDSGV